MQKSEKTKMGKGESRTVLIGTYKGDQLTKWRGWYNYPISDDDKIGAEDAAKITELWLFNGKKDQRSYKAEFVGIKTRKELVDDYGYPAKGKAHGDKYLLFKTDYKYQHKGDIPEDAERVIVRTKDFAASRAVQKQLKAYLESPDRNDPDLAKRLPTILTKLRPKQLRVCEAAVQLEFFSRLISVVEATNQNLSSPLGCVPVVVRQTPSKVMPVEEIKDRIFQGDCLQILPKFPAASVDMILCDLPYGTTQNKWDSVIPLDLLWTEYRRVLKPHGSVVLTSQGVFTAKLVLSNPDWFKYKLVWVKSKPTNFLNAKIQPLRKHEDVCVFYGRRSTYNPIMGEGVPYDKGVRKNQLSGSYGDFRPVHVQSDGKRYPTDVVYFKTAESEGEVWHPTQKPVGLGRYLVKTFSNPGDIVLDNAFGSGSFLLAAALEGRHFVGIEKNESVALFKDRAIDYIDVAVSRLNGLIPRREVS